MEKVYKGKVTSLTLVLLTVWYVMSGNILKIPTFLSKSLAILKDSIV